MPYEVIWLNKERVRCYVCGLLIDKPSSDRMKVSDEGEVLGFYCKNCGGEVDD